MLLLPSLDSLKNSIEGLYCTDFWCYPMFRSIILDNTPMDFRPIVQTIDNFERNHKLGLIFECNIFNGKLLVCSCDFDKVILKPEGMQLFFSILNYFSSDRFQPEVTIEINDLEI